MLDNVFNKNIAELADLKPATLKTWLVRGRSFIFRAGMEAHL